MSLRIFVRQLANRFRFWLILFFFVNLLLALTTSLKPYALKVLINFLAQNPFQGWSLGLSSPVIYYVFVSLFTVFCFRMHNFVWVNLAPPMRHNLILTLTEEIRNRSILFFHYHSPSKLGNHIQEVSRKIPELIQIVCDGFFCGILTLVIATITVGSVGSRYAIGLMMWIAIFVFGSILILRHAKKIGIEGSYFRSKILSKIIDEFRNIRCIRLFVREEFERKNLREILDSHLVIDKRKERYIVSTYGFQGVSFVIYQAICLFWLISDLKQDVIHLGDVALILSINLVFVDYFRKIAQYIVDFADLFGAIKYSLEEMFGPCSDSIESNLPTLSKMENFISHKSMSLGAIQFENVSFGYNKKLPLFQNISVRIEIGEKVAIIGHSGSGKSTFIHLLLRLYDSSSGSIQIGGKNIQQVSIKQLRELISVVPQFPSLFEGTIVDNIRYGKLDASDDEIVNAAIQVEIHDFIKALPEGYNTRLDSSGSTISAGQRQRIAIARAIIKNAPILILDEPMTHLDTKTAQLIENRLQQSMDQKTLIVITHHLSSFVPRADKVLVFDSGRIMTP